MKWISVKDQLPPLKSVVLVSATQEVRCGDKHTIERMSTARLGYYFDKDFWVTDFKYTEITHWMEIPEPPKDI